MPQAMNISPQAAALLDLLPDACHWPIGDTTWCGEQATHGAYCHEHHQASRAAVQRNYSPWMISKMLAATFARPGGGR